MGHVVVVCTCVRLGGEGPGRRGKVKVTLSEANICILLMRRWRLLQDCFHACSPPQRKPKCVRQLEGARVTHWNRCQNLLMTKQPLQVTWDSSLTLLHHYCIELIPQSILTAFLES